MRYSWKMLSLSLTLAAPLLMGQIAVAQTLPASPLPICSGTLAQSDTEAVKAFFEGGYTGWDAAVLADFWGSNSTEAKERAGAKLLGPVESKVYLELCLSDARAKALGGVESLRFFPTSGFTYEDAELLARTWGLGDARQGKLTIERNLIMGNRSLLEQALELSR